MKKEEIIKGIEEYKKSYKDKIFSEKTRLLEIQYIKPILDIAKDKYKKENPEVLFTSAFFLGDLIKARAGLRIDGKYKEIETFYETKHIVKNNLF